MSSDLYFHVKNEVTQTSTPAMGGNIYKQYGQIPVYNTSQERIA